MFKISILLFLAMFLLSCHEDDTNIETLEATSYSHPIFVGNDSILYLERYIKQRPTEEGILEWWARIKIMDRQGNDLSTIWEKNLYEDNTMNYWQLISLDHNANNLLFGYYDGMGHQTGIYSIITAMRLDGTVLNELNDDDLQGITYYGYNQRYAIHVSPNGMYYAIANKIKNNSAELITTVSDTILDWNSSGLLVRNTEINSETISIEGTEYALHSHPEAHFWIGQDHRYARIHQDTLYICNWTDSSISQKVWIGVTGAYSPYGYGGYGGYSGYGYSPYGYGGGYGYTQYGQPYLMNSSFSPDLQYLVLNNQGIHLIDLNTGNSTLLKADEQALPSQ